VIADQYLPYSRPREKSCLVPFHRGRQDLTTSTFRPNVEIVPEGRMHTAGFRVIDPIPRVDVFEAGGQTCRRSARPEA
jgi:hypothetical protein